MSDDVPRPVHQAREPSPTARGAQPTWLIRGPRDRHFDQGFAERCLAIIYDYQEGRRHETLTSSKSSSKPSLLRLRVQPRDVGHDVNEAFRVYLDMLDDFDRE
jgi:hypothetical protein